jgi:hypothetical protein
VRDRQQAIDQIGGEKSGCSLRAAFDEEMIDASQRGDRFG